ncbi:MAG: SCP2 sterol-binding domain-containing protein [Deltaproteobacteria bacterium]
MTLTPKQIFEEKIAMRIQSNPDLSKEVNAIYQFNVTGAQGGNWHISLNSSQNSVVCGITESPSCTITIADQDLVSLVQGTLNPQLAFMTGKLKVKGDFGLALKLGKILKV